MAKAKQRRTQKQIVKEDREVKFKEAEEENRKEVNQRFECMQKEVQLRSILNDSIIYTEFKIVNLTYSMIENLNRRSYISVGDEDELNKLNAELEWHEKHLEALKKARTRLW